MRGLVLMAPHFFTEDVGIAEIARARDAYDNGDLRGKLARWHADVDNAFRGWNGIWLDPDFRQWDITDELAYIRVPILLVQGQDDQYGTVRADRDRGAGVLLSGRGDLVAEYPPHAPSRGRGGNPAGHVGVRESVAA